MIQKAMTLDFCLLAMERKKQMTNKVPTIEEIKRDLRIPEVEKKFDRLGRVVEKKNINNVRGLKVLPSRTSIKEVKRIKSLWKKT